MSKSFYTPFIFKNKIKIIKKADLRTVILSVLLFFCSGNLTAQAFKNGQVHQPDTVQNKNVNESDSFFKNYGITFGASLTGELFANVSGGLEQEAVFIENFSLSLTLDLNRLADFKNSTVYFSVLQNNGHSLSKYIGDVQIASNIEAVQTIRLFELWFEQLLFQKRLSVLAGVYDITAEFDHMQTAGLFINSSHGMGSELGNGGLVGPATFPATALAARIKIIPFRNFYIQAAVTAGVPGVEHVDWGLSDEEGYFYIGEIGYMPLVNKGSVISRSTASPYTMKIALGGWSYSRNFVKLRYGVSTSIEENEWGMYLLIDLASLNWISDRLDALSWYARLGIADNQLSRFHLYAGSGVVWQGIFSFDQNGTAGLAIAVAKNSNIYEAPNPVGNSSFEIALELTYKTNITEWLSVQPDFQYIINPGTLPNVENAFVAGLRTMISF